MSAASTGGGSHHENLASPPKGKMAGEVTERMSPRRSGSGLFVAAALLALTAGALSIYAWQLWTQEQQALAELASTRSAVEELRQEQQATGLKLTTLQSEHTESQARLKTAASGALELETKLAATESRLGELQSERAKIEERLTEFRAMTARFQRMIDSRRLEVHFRRGRMIVELPAQVLFPSASADLSEDGSEALREVAKILRGFRDKHFIVAGHTDSVPLGTGGPFANNWELSSARAVHVTEALIRSGMLPRQLVAAGYAEHDPVANNTSAQGRQKNRRIEIVLEPRLKEMPEIDEIAGKTKTAAHTR